jgi:hypothetical protein
MKKTRRTRAWWQATVARWRRSGATAETFAKGAGVKAGTLRWWSYELARDTRAKHGSTAIVPIEIAVPSAPATPPSRLIEIVAGGALVRVETGTDVAYIAALVRALG